MSDRVSGFANGTVEYEGAGDDRILRALASASVLPDDRWRVAGRLGFGDWSGRADAVDQGATDVSESALLLGLAGFWRYRRAHVLAGGVEAYPGVPGDAPVGAWLGALWSDPEPYRALRLRAHGHMLLEEPAACVGLGGRTSGVEIAGHHDFLRRFWASFDVRWASLSLDEVPNTPAVRDGFLAGDVTLGWRLHDGQVDVAERVETDRATLPLLEGPDVDGDPRRTRGPFVAAWASYRPMRLLDDQSLAQLVPIGERFDYLALSGRADLHLAPSLGASIEGTAGYDLAADDSFFQVDAAMTWRPGHATELTLAGGYGLAYGRADAEDSLRLRVAFTLRW
jgi:hypothetical protein